MVVEGNSKKSGLGRGLGKGLGKGLNSLIPEDTAVAKEHIAKERAAAAKKGSVDTVGKTNVNDIETAPRVVEKIVEKKVVVKEPVEIKVNINSVEPNRSQPRKNFDDDSLEELAESIRTYGVLQPLVVQKRDGYYEIIAGERRWRAAKKAGIKEVPVVIREYSDMQLLEVALIENIQREDLNPIEEALAYQRLVDEFSLKQDEVAEKVSKSRVTITNSLRLLKLDKRVQNMLISGMITTGHARTLLALEKGDDQYEIAQKIFDQKLSVREIEKLIKEIVNKDNKKEKSIPENDFVYREFEEKLNGLVGSKVVIHNKSNNKGKIEITYNSREEFERIYELMEKSQKQIE